jgi:hypothetical protein
MKTILERELHNGGSTRFTLVFLLISRAAPSLRRSFPQPAWNDGCSEFSRREPASLMRAISFVPNMKSREARNRCHSRAISSGRCGLSKHAGAHKHERGREVSTCDGWAGLPKTPTYEIPIILLARLSRKHMRLVAPDRHWRRGGCRERSAFDRSQLALPLLGDLDHKLTI